MVKKTVPGLALISALLLSSCGLFSASLFPSYLNEAWVVADLNAVMDPYIGDTPEDYIYGLYDLKNSFGQEYLFLVMYEKNGPGRRLVILDADLRVKKTVESGLLGRLHLVDVNGNFQIGQLSFDRNSLSQITVAGIDKSRYGFSFGIKHYMLWIDDSAAGLLQYERRDAVWNPEASTNFILNGVVEYQLLDLAYDPGRTGLEVTLFLRQKGTSQVSWVSIGQDDFPGPALTPPILTFYPTVTIDDPELAWICYTREGIVVRHRDRRYSRYRLSDGAFLDSHSLEDKNDLSAESFDRDGRCFYYLGVNERRLYKFPTWWTP